MKRLLLFLTLALTILPAQAQRYMQAVSKFADLVNPALVGPQTNLWLNGYYGTNDGGGGAWTIVPDDGTATNAGTVVKVTTGWLAKRNYSPPISVKWFGAKGDGSDDSAAVNAAIAEAGSVGNRVYLPKTVPWGLYAFNLALTGPISLEGDLPNAGGVGGVTISAYNTNSPCIQIGDGVTLAADVTLKNLNFCSYPRTATRALKIHGAHRVRVLDCTFNWWDTYCLKIDGTIAAPTTDIKFYNCWFQPSSGPGDGVILSAGGLGLVTSCYFNTCFFYDGGAVGHSMVNDSTWSYFDGCWWQFQAGHGITWTNTWTGPFFEGYGNTVEANAGTSGIGLEGYNDGGPLNTFEGGWKFYCSQKLLGGAVIDLSTNGPTWLGYQTMADNIYLYRNLYLSSGAGSNNIVIPTNNAIHADASGNLYSIASSNVYAVPASGAGFSVYNTGWAVPVPFTVNQFGANVTYPATLNFNQTNAMSSAYIFTDTGNGWGFVNPSGSITFTPKSSASFNVYNVAWATQTPFSVSDSLVTVRSPQVNQSTISLTGAGTSALDLKSADATHWFTIQAPVAMDGNYNLVLPGSNVTGVAYSQVVGTNLYLSFPAQLPVGTLAPTNPVASMVLGFDGTERIWEKVGIGLTNSGNTQINVNMKAGSNITLTTNADNSLTVAASGSGSQTPLTSDIDGALYAITNTANLATWPNYRRWSQIGANGNSTTASTFMDSLATTTGTAAMVHVSDTNGEAIKYTSTTSIGDQCGWRTTALWRTGNRCRFETAGLIQTNGVRWVAGFTDGTSTTMLGSATPSANCAVFQFSDIDSHPTVFVCYTANTGAGAGNSATVTTVAADGLWHNFDILEDEANSRVVFFIDHNPVGTNTTHLPNTNGNITQNGMNFMATQTGGQAAVNTIGWINCSGLR